MQLSDEYNAVDSYHSELVAVSTILPQMKEFLQLYLAADSNEKFIKECMAHFSLSEYEIQFILRLPISQLKNANKQSLLDHIEIYSAISEFIKRMAFGYWQRNEKEGDNVEVSYRFDVKKKEWIKYCKIIEEEYFDITYLFNAEKNEWEKDYKMEYEPSLNYYTWDKQNEKWQFKENYDT